MNMRYSNSKQKKGSRLQGKYLWVLLGVWLLVLLPCLFYPFSYTRTLHLTGTDLAAYSSKLLTEGPEDVILELEIKKPILGTGSCTGVIKTDNMEYTFSYPTRWLSRNPQPNTAYLLFPTKSILVFGDSWSEAVITNYISDSKILCFPAQSSQDAEELLKLLSEKNNILSILADEFLNEAQE
ncbi:hypothetical protein EV209_2247 [Cuneatibacter caecimuris]|uniref:Uncharacterized protein n=2 Tax=Cuneatibacter caecimuris TaxID=1796618 RepID=A0A4Q7P3K7_9FIRM|nr:hypothetical protein EV209_2247 [Cuneatibacter caecimuris]